VLERQIEEIAHIVRHGAVEAFPIARSVIARASGSVAKVRGEPRNMLRGN
jgi:hypothetical protein